MNGCKALRPASCAARRRGSFAIIVGKKSFSDFISDYFWTGLWI